MRCPRCEKNIPDDSKFCLECGSNISSLSNQSGIEGDVSIGDIKTIGRLSPVSSFDDIGTVMEPLSDRYELLEEIGRGGFAVVHKARDKKLGRIVAIKKLLADSDEVEAQTLERFKREARVIAGLNHRNVVGVFDVGEDPDGIYLVMEYIEGGSLRDLLKKKGTLSLSEALSLTRGMVQGLSYAHRNNLVHRDIKPANILLMKEGAELIPKIVDFGLAQAGRDSELSISGYGMGSPWYMPPEQRRDAKNVNHTADIYALGKVLYEMVTGEIPDNVDPQLIPPPDQLSDVIFKCIKSKSSERFFSADELLQALEGLEGKVQKKSNSGSTPVHASTCSACGSENPLDVRYCQQCGGGMFRDCPECGQENRVSKAYCGACGTDVEGFVGAIEIMERMDRFTAEKKWSRVVKEFGLFNPELRLRGSKGMKLKIALEKAHTSAEESLAERAELKEKILALQPEENQLGKALGLIEKYLKIDPLSTEMAELKVELGRQIDERDYGRAMAERALAEEKGEFDQAASRLKVYLEKYPKGLHAEEVTQILQAEVAPLVVEMQKQQKRRRIRNRLVRFAFLVVLLACAAGCYFGIRYYQVKDKIVAFERAAMDKEVETVQRLGAQLEGHYNTKPILFELAVYEDARKSFEVSAATNLQSLLETGDPECEELNELIAGLLLDRGFADAKERYKKATELANGISLRNESLISMSDAYTTALAGYSADEYKAFVPELWESLNQARDKIGNELDQAKKIALWRSAILLADQTHAECENQMALEKKLSETRSSFADVVQPIPESEYKKYVSERWDEVVELKVQATEEADRARALLLWDEAILKARQTVEYSQTIKEADETMQNASQDLASILVLFAEDHGYQEKEREGWADYGSLYFAKELATKFPSSSKWENVLSIISAAESNEASLNYIEASEKYQLAITELKSMSGSRLMLPREQLYNECMDKAKIAKKEERWSDAYEQIAEAENTGYVDPLGLSTALKGELDEELEDVHLLQKNYLSFVDEIGEDLLSKHCSDRWRVVQELYAQCSKGDPAQIKMTFGWASDNLANCAMTVYYQEALQAKSNENWSVCRSYCKKAGELSKVAELTHPEALENLKEIGSIYAEDLPWVVEGRDWTVRLDAGFEMNFKSIAPGRFEMGSGSFLGFGGHKEEQPSRRVDIAKPYWMAQAEVTQAQYEKIMKTNPSGFADSWPVVNIDWDSAVAFCRKLTELELKSGHLPEGYEYRLPTEAQWEYACRAGNKKDVSEKRLRQAAWFMDNAGGSAHSVASKSPNAFGLFDMQGNVREWCADAWHNNYKGAPSSEQEFKGGDPKTRVVRGGGWGDIAEDCRFASRGFRPKSSRQDSVGFRPVVVKK